MKEDKRNFGFETSGRHQAEDDARYGAEDQKLHFFLELLLPLAGIYKLLVRQCGSTVL